MRVGFNPNKDQVLPKSDYNHQVIVPVYIPHQNDYFKDSFQILQWCLESLFKTCHAKTYFTVVNNGSCEEVRLYLNELFQKNMIQEVIHTTAIGKLNAILKGLTGHQFPLITITDADVLFLNDWQKATYEVFESFPRTGVVCPVPITKLVRYLTANIILDCLFSKTIKTVAVKNAKAMKAFAISVGNEQMFSERELAYCLVVEKTTTKALIGAGHFVSTYRGEIFNHIKDRSINYLLGTGEGFILDNPAYEQGFWRLSTYDNYAYHMGNTEENWMQEKLNSIFDNDKMQETVKLVTMKIKRNTILNKVFEKIIFNNKIWKIYEKSKGFREI